MDLRCYAERSGGEWEAFCLDLNLAVQGRTFEEAHGLLTEAIEEYLAHVATLPEDERGAFLRRPAPLGIRLRYLFTVLMSTLFRARGGTGGGDRHEFFVSAPA